MAGKMCVYGIATLFRGNVCFLTNSSSAEGLLEELGC